MVSETTPTLVQWCLYHKCTHPLYFVFQYDFHGVHDDDIVDVDDVIVDGDDY